jgi:LysR family transcriptional activator of nhaA
MNRHARRVRQAIKVEYIIYTARKFRSNDNPLINCKYLYYFWAVAREGGVARASERLNLTSQTISGQLSLPDEYLGVDMFSRVGRNLELTDTGRIVLSYGDENFFTGR